MTICFPKHTKEGKRLIEAVGLVEATRDWMENNYEVRTPEQVMAKLNDRGVAMPYDFRRELSGEANPKIVSIRQELDRRLPGAVSNAIKIVSKVPSRIIGNPNIQLSMEAILEKTDITDPLLINWLGINKNQVSAKSVKSTAQLENIIQKTYDKKVNNDNVELKKEVIKKFFNEWVNALEKYPVAFRDQMLKHATKYLLNPARRNKYVLNLSEVALSRTYSYVANQPHKLNQAGRIYNEEVLKTVNESENVIHEPSASGKGYWVIIPRTDQSEKSTYKLNKELLEKLSPHTWCTSSGMASHYVQEYSNYLLIVNGKTVAGIEARDNKTVKEVTSLANNGMAPIDYLDDILAFFNKYGLDTNNESLNRAIAAREKGKTDADIFDDFQLDPEEIRFQEEQRRMIEAEVRYAIDLHNGEIEFDPPEPTEEDMEYDEERMRMNTIRYMIGVEAENATTPEDIRALIHTLDLANDTFNYHTTRNLQIAHYIANRELLYNEELATELVRREAHEITAIPRDAPFYLALTRIAVELDPNVYAYISEEAKLDDVNRNRYETFRQNRIDDLPFSLTQDKQIQGYYDAGTDQAVIVASNTSVEDSPKVGIHEVAHRGMVRIARELGGTEELYQALLSSKKQLMEKLPELLKRTGHKDLNSLMLDYGFSPDTREGELKLMMELAARWAETLVNKSKPSWWKELLQNIRQWIKNFIGVDLTEQEVDELVGGFVRYGTDTRKVKYKESTGYPEFDEVPSYYTDLQDLIESPAALNGMLSQLPFSLSPTETQKAMANEFMKKLLNGLSERTGIQYAFISPEEAMAITANAPNPWNARNPQPAFYYGGVVYFVGDSINTTIAFHEFAHPIIDVIYDTNPELFKSLFNELKSTQEGRNLIAAMLRDGSYGTDESQILFQKEALVRAISEKANANYLNKTTSEGFTAWIKNIMYHIKQLLRKAFGKIKIEKLSPNTTIEQMAEMLTNDTFKIETPVVTEEGIVQYMKYLDNELRDDLVNAGKDLSTVIFNFSERVTTPLRTAIQNEDWQYVWDKTKDDLDVEDQNQIREIARDLRPFVDQIKKMGERKLEELDNLNEQAVALATAMGRLDYVLNNFETDMREMSYRSKELLKKDQLTPEEAKELKTLMIRAHYIHKIAQYWKKFYEDHQEIERAVKDQPTTNPWRRVIDRTKGRISSIEGYYGPIIVAGNKSWILAVLEPMRERIDRNYKKQIEDLRKINDTKNLKKVQDEYEKVRITPQRIEEMLKGEWDKDANPFNTFLEAYMYSTDDVVGGFTVWLQGHLTDIDNSSIKRYTTFLQEVMPMLKELGYDANNIDQIINWVAREDLDGYTDPETGNWVETKVWRFRSKHKNFNRDAKNWIHKKNKAQEKAIKTNDFTEYNQVLEDIENWKQKFFYREFKDDVYNLDKIFEETYIDDNGNVIDIGAQAKAERDRIFREIKELETSYESEEDRIAKVTKKEALWKEYTQLVSLKDSKDQDKPVGSREYRIAKILQKYKEASKGIYIWRPKLNKFQQKYEEYSDLMARKFADNTEAYEAAMQEWWDTNTVVAATPEYYKTTSDILKKIIAIYQEASGKSTEALELSNLHKELNDLLWNYRDDDGQTNGKAIGAETRSRIKAIQERIMKLRDDMNGSLNGDERERLEYYEDMMLMGDYDKFTDAEKKDFDELTAKIQAPSRDGLTPAQRVNLSIYFRQLNVYRSKQATTYYLDIINSYLMGTDLLDKFPQIKNFDKRKGKEGIITHLTAEYLLGAFLTDEAGAVVMKDKKPVLLIDALLDASPELKSWWLKNHIKIKKWDATTRRKQDAWQRLPQWSVVRPNAKSNFVHTTVRDRDGKLISKPGKPALRFYVRDVKGLSVKEQADLDILRAKKESGTASAEDLKTIAKYEQIEREGFKTRQVVGDTIDNRGRWLPKTMAEGAPNNDYIDQEYLDMENGTDREKKIFRLTEAFKKHHLESQKGVDRYGKLYLDIPRFRKNRYERIRSTNPIPRWWEGVKSMFVKRPDDFNEGVLNPDANANVEDAAEDLARLGAADMYTNEELYKRFPMQGIYQLPVEEVSPNILYSMARYMHGAERLKKLREINPIAESLQETLMHPNNKLKKMSKSKSLMYRFMHTLKSSDENATYYRSAAVNNLIEREFFGKNNAGFLADNASINKITNMMFRGASMSYLAVQLPSAVTNALAQMVQNVIEGFGGEYFTLKDLGVGSVDASKAMMDISMEIYKQGVNSYDVQLVNLFNAIPGRAFEGDGKFGSNASRSMMADAVSLSWLYSPRKFMETYATLQGFYAIMNHLEVEQTVNGQKQKIKYKDAFEIKDGQIVIKQGIDPTYDIGGEKYKEIKNQITMIQYAMNGAYDKFGQPEASRYLVFRMFAFLRKYFTTMMTNRFGGAWNLASGTVDPRHNPGMLDARTGFYVESIRAFSRGITSNGKYFYAMKASEKAAFKKLFAEIAVVLLADLLISAFFGWDPDDDEKYDKLRAKSGAMPLPGVAEDEYPFEWGGWFSNHALFQLMQIEAQTQMWMPLPGWGLKDYTAMASLEPASVAPTVELYSKIFDDLANMIDGNEKAYYQRSVGPYEWQQKGELKVWNHVGNIIGLRGVFAYPVDAGIAKKEQARARR